MRVVTTLLVSLVLFVGLLPATAAQDAPAPGVGDATVGTPVAIYNSEGIEAARVTVLEVIDPFEDWGEFYAPQIDERYVVVTVQVENTGERPFAFTPYDFQLLHAYGRLHFGFPHFRSETAVAAMPDLEEASMLPGETVMGALSYVVPVDAPIAQVAYMFYADTQHLYLLADLNAPVQAGTPAA